MDNILENDPQNGTALEQAIKEAVDDETFRKVKRMSYSGNSAGEVSLLGQIFGLAFDKCISYLPTIHLANNLFDKIFDNIQGLDCGMHIIIFGSKCLN